MATVPVYINALRLDASISEQHTYAAEVTEFPVESGGAIVDHVRPVPIEVTIEGVVSNTPIGELAINRSLETASFTDTDGTVKVYEESPVSKALAMLEGLYADRVPVEIVTSLKTYKNMAMVSIDIPRDASGGGDNAIRFTATFKQIMMVTTDRVQVRTAVPRAGKKKPKGPVTAVPVTWEAIYLRNTSPVVPGQPLPTAYNPAPGEARLVTPVPKHPVLEFAEEEPYRFTP